MSTVTCFKGFHNLGERAFNQHPIDGWSKTGSFGPGLYFGDLNCAQVYAEKYYPNDAIYKAVVKPKNTLELHVSDEHLDEFGIDTYALPLISSAFDVDLDEAAMLFSSLATNDNHLGDAILNKLVSKGYDSIHVVYNRNPDVFEFVVLDPKLKIEITTLPKFGLEIDSPNSAPKI
jgi:hypothetical protein